MVGFPYRDYWAHELRPVFERLGCNDATCATIYKSYATRDELKTLAVDARADRVDHAPAWIVGTLKRKGLLRIGRRDPPRSSL